MASTILSSLGEPILYRNSLATITSNWVVVRQGASGRQAVVAIQSIAELRPIKSIPRYSFVASLASLLMALAAYSSKEPNGAALPFALFGLALLSNAVARRRVALGLVVGQEIIETIYGTTSEAAAFVATVHAARNDPGRSAQSPYSFLSWLRAYLSLLV